MADAARALDRIQQCSSMSGGKGPVEQVAPIRRESVAVNGTPRSPATFTGSKRKLAHGRTVTPDTPPYPHRIVPSADPLPIALMAIVAILVDTVLGNGPVALLTDLTLVAAVVAAGERRHIAMLVAAGLACGLAAYGAMLVPFALGIAIQRRVRATLLLLTPMSAAVTAAAATATLGTLPLPDGRGIIGLAAIVPKGATDGLLLAAGLGAAAWMTAMLTIRPLPGRTSISAATMVALGAALVIPQTSMAMPIALAVLARDRRVAAAAGIATLLAATGQPLVATVALLVALTLVARPFLGTAANDNSPLPVLRDARPAASPDPA